MVENNSLSTIKKPISVYFRKDAINYIDVVKNSNIEGRASCTDLKFETKLCQSWDELSGVLKEDTYQLIFHVNMLDDGVTIHEFISMLETLIKVTLNKKIPIAISIEKNTPLSSIKEFQKTSLHGIVPCTSGFGSFEAFKGLEALFNRIPYWPKHILDQLPGSTTTVAKNNIKLTGRQLQVFNLILDRGLTNKKIAKALNITESTVKIHVSSILKAYGVRTRTQLVVMSQK